MSKQQRFSPEVEAAIEALMMKQREQMAAVAAIVPDPPEVVRAAFLRALQSDKASMDRLIRAVPPGLVPDETNCAVGVVEYFSTLRLIAEMEAGQ